MEPILCFVIPSYNEEQVLPETCGLFLGKLISMIDAGKISQESRSLFVNDGSKDATWSIISSLTEEDEHFAGISLAHNRGHQNALIAGLMEALLRAMGIETKRRPRYIIDENKNLKSVMEE